VALAPSATKTVENPRTKKMLSAATAAFRGGSTLPATAPDLPAMKET
jgi:hypothetical protein